MGGVKQAGSKPIRRYCCSDEGEIDFHAQWRELFPSSPIHSKFQNSGLKEVHAPLMIQQGLELLCLLTRGLHAILPQGEQDPLCGSLKGQ